MTFRTTFLQTFPSSSPPCAQVFVCLETREARRCSSGVLQPPIQEGPCWYSHFPRISSPSWAVFRHRALRWQDL